MIRSRWSQGLRLIALFEVAKGLVGVAIAYVLITQGERDIEKLSNWVVGRFHLDPTEGLGSKILLSAQHVDDSQVHMLTALAFAYVAVRFVEAYGLWWERKWAEWFAAISAALYVPFELWEVLKHPGPLKLLLIGANIGIVAFLVKVITRDRKLRASTAPAPARESAG
jgi:uncharacterized membrane protein (DUF2068 family)